MASLFAGVGGMDIGGHMNGFDTVYAADWHSASKTFFANNFPNAVFDQVDVRLVNLERINEKLTVAGKDILIPGELDVLTAGSPCVKLAPCNTVDARNFCEENFLMTESLPFIVAELQPKIAWFENSERLMSKNNKRLKEEFYASITNVCPNYVRQTKVMNAIRYGGFQTRSRAMTVLVRKDILDGRKVKFFPARGKVDLQKQGAHVLLPHISKFWHGQFEKSKKFKDAVGNIFCTLTASGNEKVQDHFGSISNLNNEDRKKLTGMEHYIFDGICDTNVKMLLGNMVLRQLSELMFNHFKTKILMM